MVPKKLKSYTTAFKLAVIDKAENIAKHVAGRKFQMNVALSDGDLKNLCWKKCPKQREQARRSGDVVWPNLENNLAKWVREQ